MIVEMFVVLVLPWCREGYKLVAVSYVTEVAKIRAENIISKWRGVAMYQGISNQRLN